MFRFCHFDLSVSVIIIGVIIVGVISTSMADGTSISSSSSSREGEVLSCRFCFEDISPLEESPDAASCAPCACAGTLQLVHVKCLQRWRAAAILGGAGNSGTDAARKRAVYCNVCKQKYNAPPPTQEELLALCRGETGAAAAALLGVGALIVAAGRLGGLSVPANVPVWFQALLKKRMEFWANAVVLLYAEEPGQGSDGSDSILGVNLASGFLRTAENESDSEEDEDGSSATTSYDGVGDSPLASWRRGRRQDTANDDNEGEARTYFNDGGGTATRTCLGACRRLVYLQGGPVMPRTSSALVPFAAFRAVLAAARKAHAEDRQVPTQVRVEHGVSGVSENVIYGSLIWGDDRDLPDTSSLGDAGGDDELDDEAVLVALADLVGIESEDPSRPGLRCHAIDRHSPFLLHGGRCGDARHAPPTPPLHASDEAIARAAIVHKSRVPPGAWEAAIDGHEVLVFKGFCRWSTHQLLAEMERGDWGISRARATVDEQHEQPPWWGDGLPRSHLHRNEEAVGVVAMHRRAHDLHKIVSASGRPVFAMVVNTPQ